MDKIFQEFLFLSRPVPETMEPVSLKCCIRDCVDLLAARFEQADVSAIAELPDNDITVMGQASGLKRALINLLSNAEQFSKKGDCVTVRCFREEDRAVIEVLDQGPGVPEADKKRIFEMFVTTRSGGTGLGLSLAKTAVENCGGTIEVVNRPEGGACFKVVLPALRSQIS